MTDLEINLHQLSNSATDDTIERVIETLEASRTTLTKLVVFFYGFEPTPENIRRVIDPLCRSIPDQRFRNADHPLLELRLRGAYLDDDDGMLVLFEQFLIAAKRFGIRHMTFIRGLLPVHVLLEYCRDNTSLEWLELDHVCLTDGGTEMILPPNVWPQNSSLNLAVDELHMDNVTFINSTAATKFSNLVAHMDLSFLAIGLFTVLGGGFEDGGDDDDGDGGNEDDDDDDDGGNDDDDVEMSTRIVSEFMKSSPSYLALNTSCRVEHCKAALVAGTTSLFGLDVGCFVSEDGNDTSGKLSILASFIRGAVQLEYLALPSWCNRPSLHLFQAIDACATVTDIQLIDDDLSEHSCDQRLQEIVDRNLTLHRFLENPSIFPTDELPTLMRQFDNCPSGLRMLTSQLPAIFSFEDR